VGRLGGWFPYFQLALKFHEKKISSAERTVYQPDMIFWHGRQFDLARIAQALL
jgi:hypothetical protein